MHPRVHFWAVSRNSFDCSVVHLLGVVIDQFTLEQIQRCLVVQNDVVKRVGQNFGHPHQAGLHVFDEALSRGSTG